MKETQYEDLFSFLFILIVGVLIGMTIAEIMHPAQEKESFGHTVELVMLEQKVMPKMSEPKCLIRCYCDESHIKVQATCDSNETKEWIPLALQAMADAGCQDEHYQCNWTGNYK